MIWLVIKYVPYLIIAFAGLLLLAMMYANRNKVSATGLKEAIRNFIGVKLLAVIVVSAVFFAFFSFVRYCYNKTYPTMYVSLNYEEAASGLNPNGTRFNASEIISDDVLNEVIKRGGYNVSADDLKHSLSLETNYDDVSISSTASDDEINSLSIATDYRLVFKPTLRTASIDARNLLNLIGDVYYSKFMSEKTENTAVLDVDLSGYKDYGYHSIAGFLQTKADNLKHFIDVYRYKDSNYRAANGDTFAALSGKINDYTTVELERFESFVVENGLSDDPAGYSAEVDYTNKLLQLDYDKAMAAYNVRLEAIDMYDHQMARIVLVPTQDEQLEYYMSRTKIGVDDYADEAQEYLANAKELKNQMDNNTYAQGRVNSMTATTETYEKADSLAKTIMNELTELAAECKEIVTAYNTDKKSTLIQTGLYTNTLTSMIDYKKGIISTAVFAVIAVGFAFCTIFYGHNVVVRRRNNR